MVQCAPQEKDYCCGKGCLYHTKRTESGAKIYVSYLCIRELSCSIYLAKKKKIIM